MLKKEKVVVLVLMFFLILAFVPNALAFNHIISNSGDWKDVYSAMMFANLNNAGKDFLVSTRHGPLLINDLNRQSEFRIISSRRDSFVINYEDMLRAQGFEEVEEVVIDDGNLELIEELPDVKNFVIISDTYGYSAIAVAPYANINNAWVFFADRINIDEIDSIMSNRDVDEVLIYGFVDRSVRDTLAKYNPEIIDTGDRFKDNTIIVDKYLEIKPMEQVLLSNGEFLEKEIISGANPVLFTGKENVPVQISTYLKSSDIQVGVLVGSDLVGAATNIRRSTGISVIVKFARGARSPAGAIAAVEGLDLYYLPIPVVSLGLHSAKYNRATSQLELTYKSESNVPIFFRGTITPITDGVDGERLGDVDPIFIAPNDFKTVSYSGVDFTGDDLSLEIFTLFGDTPSSLEKILEATIDVEIVNIIDSCEINIEEVVYSKPKEAFIIKVRNLGDNDCYVDVELRDVLIDGIPTTLGSEGSVLVKAGKLGKILIEQEMTDEDLENNNFVNVVAYFGEREDSLIKVIQGKYELKIESISYATIGLIGLIIAVLGAIFFLFFLWRRRRKEEEDF